MSLPTDEDQENHDADFERAMYEIMTSCGWFLPTSEEDLRRAAAELAAAPVILPISLRDPYRVLDGIETASGTGADNPQPLARLTTGGLQIPSGLQRLANEVGLSFDHVTALIGMQGQIVANRSTSRNEEPSYDDWKRFYDAVKEFL